MTVYALKPQFQTLLRPAARCLHRAGVTANQVTVVTCLVSIGLGVWLAIHADVRRVFLALPVWCLLRMAFNAIDGLLAREYGQRSRLGAYLNELTDPISDTALYLPFAFVAGASAGLVTLTIFLALLSEMAGVLGAVVGGQRRNEGPMGKSDRALVFGCIALVLGCGVAPGGWLNWAMAAIAILLVLTIVNRVKRGIADQPASSRG